MSEPTRDARDASASGPDSNMNTQSDDASFGGGGSARAKGALLARSRAREPSRWTRSSRSATTIKTRCCGLGLNSPTTRKGPSSRPMPTGFTRSRHSLATCSTRSITSSELSTPFALRVPKGSRPAWTWSSGSCTRSWRSMASSRSSAGCPFDPHFHDAVMQQPSTDHPEGTVVSELSRGYTIRERVLRPSKVAVSARPAAQ